jgi:hypothetical protein
MRDVMVDLETMGVEPGSAITSIGAVFFNPETGDMGSEFKVNINLHSSDEVGAIIDENTMDWWVKQSEAAQQGLADPKPIDLKDALFNFGAWLMQNHKDPYLWGNGVLFDNLFLRTAYKQVGWKCPWHFRNDRDVRTLVAIGARLGIRYGDDKERLVHHDALDDAKYQVKYCSRIWRYIHEAARISDKTRSFVVSNKQLFGA